MRTERFNKAYDALVKAFFEGTLAKGDCTACAVGNICKESGLLQNIKNDEWAAFFSTGTSGKQAFNINGRIDVCEVLGFRPGKAILLIDGTGYNIHELAKVEKAFELNTKIFFDRYEAFSEQEILEDQFNGLCAVVDVLLKLDNISPEDHYKNKFREHPQLV